MPEGVLTDDGFVRLNGDSEYRANHTTGITDFRRVNVGGNFVVIGASFDRHDYFFKSSVTCALTESVDAAFNLRFIASPCRYSIGNPAR